VNLVGNAVTAAVTLLGVLLGGWLSVRNQERLWNRDHARQWRDIRLAAYSDFLAAYREYFAFALEPAARIASLTRIDFPDEPLPYFDELGRPYKEKLDSALMVVRLVSEMGETTDALHELVAGVRGIAAARATSAADEIPQGKFDLLWEAQKRFIIAARRELGLTTIDQPL
jgi:hypothetical protein